MQLLFWTASLTINILFAHKEWKTMFRNCNKRHYHYRLLHTIINYCVKYAQKNCQMNNLAYSDKTGPVESDDDGTIRDESIGGISTAPESAMVSATTVSDST